MTDHLKIMTLMKLFALSCAFHSSSSFLTQHHRQRRHVITRAIHPFHDSVALHALLQDDNDDRGENLGKMVRSIGGGMGDKVGVGSIVVAGREIPSLGIKIHQSYEVKEIFDKAASDDGLVEKIPVTDLGYDVAPDYTRYIMIYNQMYQEEPVVVTPEEMGLVSMRQEIVDSVWMALPILTFWTTLCFTFSKLYTDRYGGDFMDALFGR